MLDSATAHSSDPANDRTAIAELLQELASDDVRALAALVASPQLLACDAAPMPTLTDGWRHDSLLARRGWLCDLDANPEPLRSHLARSNARQLGRYAEALWQFWFAQLPGARLYAAGLPVKDGPAVRGEYDFIVALPGLRGVQHLEMGYKFYLHCPPGDGWSRLFGPNPVDRLDRKWQHMIDAQLPLSQTALGRAALPLGVGAVTPRACLQGWLFYPLAASTKAAIAGLSLAHWRGWWCHSDDAGNGAGAPWEGLAEGWTVLPRLCWIAPAVVRDGRDVFSASTCTERLAAHFTVSSQAQLIAGLERHRDGVWRETVRVFVVARGWPAKAGAQAVHSKPLENERMR